MDYCFKIISMEVNERGSSHDSEEEEILGLDIGEHEMESYSGFQIFTVE